MGGRDPLALAAFALQARLGLEDDERARLREEIVATLAGALAHYEGVLALPIPDKLPMPLLVHRHEGEQCPRCASACARSTSRTT